MTRKEEGTGLIYREESYVIIGACFAFQQISNLSIFGSENFASFRVFRGQKNL
jgi:hypothetical protein